ncbi:uncharacterized protein [Leptinotarsa decemlineata]|uniref:uncharacterized protein n=1 Tax=Leptinotarsa decemlineata TaxID=7539 RepID=UPI003D3083FA
MAESEIQLVEKLRKKRSVCKSKLTIFNKFIIHLENKYPDKCITDSDVLFDLQVRLERISRLIEDYDKVQSEIESLNSVDTIVEENERESFETNFFACVGKAKRYLASVSAGGEEQDETHSRKSYASGHAPLPDGINKLEIRETRLPEITLKIFDGSLDSWPEFRDTFESIIHSRTNISDIEKFHHLRRHLTEEVYEHIGSLDYSSENYKYAWQAICKRYNESTDLTQHHLERLFELEKIEIATSTGIRKVVDATNNRLKALSTLGEHTEHWGTFIIFMTLSKLDDDTSARWQEVKQKYERPSWQNFSDFLEKRAILLSNIEKGKSAKSVSNSTTKDFPSAHKNVNTRRDDKHGRIKSFICSNESNEAPIIRCPNCKNPHFISECSDFKKLSIKNRLERAKQRGLCINCLKPGHLVRQCRSSSCKICKSRHHTMLHIDKATNLNCEAEPFRQTNETITAFSAYSACNSQVILSTVTVRVRDSSNKVHFARALLDPGSQSSFITSELCEHLKLETVHTQLVVGGLNETYSQVKHRCNLNIQSNTNDFSLNVSCLVVPQITGDLPNFKIDLGKLDIPQNIQLADPNFHIPNRIDILIGADHFWEIICVGKINLGFHGPILQKSRFGWIVAGPIQASSFPIVQCNFSKNIQIDKQLERFWSIEEFPYTKALSHEEILAETHFVENTKRDEKGRFVVSIPLKLDPELLGDSQEVAKKRFLRLERKLQNFQTFGDQYRKFIDEYRALGHMVKVTEPDNAKNVYYMPHHGVIKEASLSTKLRVVFDSSCSTTSGYSLNDLQLVGPTIQSDLFSILLLYRKHNFVIAGDIEKMYRMCLVDPTQRSLQRILWRDNPENPVDTYELTTVTYGTSSAAFLAIRCLYQLGVECEDAAAAEVIKHHFYVDDMLTGGATVTETVETVNKVIKVLESGGFHLRKFISNSSEILQRLVSKNDSQLVDLGVNENAKTLGMIWNALTDRFLYKISVGTSTRVTKRTVLSETSQIFDPLGLLSPSILLAKLIMRDIWMEKIDWDESLPSNLHTRWSRFRDELKDFNELSIPRRVICPEFVSLEIHGFLDSSAHAYGACVYIKSCNSRGEAFVNLACAKSKVAPLKIQTIPRLELIASLLMCRMVDKVKNSLKLKVDLITYWTDSTVVLGWIATPVNLLQVFVANRVAAIQELSDSANWRHVPTEDNPADHVSRGIVPGMLGSLKIYWCGPSWLQESEGAWPFMPTKTSTLPELKKVVFAHKATIETFDIFDRYSNLAKIRRIVAYCLRFRKNSSCHKDDRNLGPLTCDDIDSANSRLVRLTQNTSFRNEIRSIREGKGLDRSSKILKLNPFLDEQEILRVGGRLANSNFPFSQRHPILLNNKCQFTELLFSLEHTRLMHAGPQLLLAHIRQTYWPIAGRSLARRIVRECVTCFRTKPTITNPLMGNLPATRVNPSPPFFISSVDYAGPFKVKDRQGRGCKISKAYASVFVCFTTRAVHIELVPDLTKDSFIAAFRRFIARRGKPSRMYSDNGTNFVGAFNELHDLGVFLKTNSKNIAETVENEGISWSFIPAASPHFGGLWEASVKSMKHHLIRVAGNALLTFEQFYTLLVQIEAILNSRPMHPLSSDPSDLNPLTPSHFIIGRPMISIADTNLLAVPDNRLKHYERIQQIQQHFWKRWSSEYVCELQVRTKWRTNQEALRKDDLVIIKDDDLPPFKWALGRIVSVHPGKDGISRVATIQTKAGLLRRAFSKICVLPKADSFSLKEGGSFKAGAMSNIGNTEEPGAKHPASTPPCTATC